MKRTAEDQPHATSGCPGLRFHDASAPTLLGMLTERNIDGMMQFIESNTDSPAFPAVRAVKSIRGGRRLLFDLLKDPAGPYQFIGHREAFDLLKFHADAEPDGTLRVTWWHVALV